MATTSISLSGCTEIPSVASTEHKKLLVMASLIAPEMPESVGQERTPISVSAVIDRSGSMQGSKLMLTKNTLRFVISNLRSSDEFGLISYASQVTEELPVLPMDAAGRQKALHAVESLQASGNTNLSGGLFAGIDQLRGSPTAENSEGPTSSIKNEVTSVWLFTDGCANEGIRSSSELARCTAERLQGAAAQCSVFTFGFGANHDATMLTEVADAGHGMYYHIESADSIAEAFADCLGGLLTVVARNIKLTATPAAGVKLCRLFTNFDKQLEATQAWVALPDLYAEERRDLLLEVEVDPVAPCDVPAAVVTWALEYRNLLTDENETASTCCYLSRPEEAPPAAPHPLLDEQRNRVRCVDGIEGARRRADAGDLPGARQGLQELRRSIQDTPSAESLFCRGLLKDIDDCLGQLHSREEYRTAGSMTMNSRGRAHMNQRSCGAHTPQYQTSTKTEMIFRSAQEK